MSCHVILRLALLHKLDTCHNMSCHVMSFHVWYYYKANMSCHVVSCHVISRHLTSCYIMSSLHVISRLVMSHHVTSCHVMSCQVTCDTYTCHVTAKQRLVIPCHHVANLSSEPSIETVTLCEKLAVAPRALRMCVSGAVHIFVAWQAAQIGRI